MILAINLLIYLKKNIRLGTFSYSPHVLGFRIDKNRLFFKCITRKAFVENFECERGVYKIKCYAIVINPLDGEFI